MKCEVDLRYPFITDVHDEALHISIVEIVNDFTQESFQLNYSMTGRSARAATLHDV